jgi:hypothetical protein
LVGCSADGSDYAENEIGSTEQALNATPAVTATDAITTVRNFGASCVVRDSSRNRDVVVAAFGYSTSSGTRNRTYDVFDDAVASPSKWVSSGTVSAGGVNATPVAHPGAMQDPNDNTKCYFVNGDSAGGVSKEVWQVRVAAGVATWTKKNDTSFAHTKFGIAQCGTVTKKIIVVAGGINGANRTNQIETFDGTNWTTETALARSVGDVAFVKVSDRKFVIAGGDDNVAQPSDAIHAIRTSTACAVEDIGMITGKITARQDAIVVPTEETSFSGSPTDPSQVMVAAGWDTVNLVTQARFVNIDWKSVGFAPSYISDSAGVVPTTGFHSASFVDAYQSPFTAANQPGHMAIAGFTAAGAPVNQVAKWKPSTKTWTYDDFTGSQVRGGTAAVYVPSYDKVVSAGGTNVFTPGGTTVDYTNADTIQ